jgi:hypothetical protein
MSIAHRVFRAAEDYDTRECVSPKRAPQLQREKGALEFEIFLGIFAYGTLQTPIPNTEHCQF